MPDDSHNAVADKFSCRIRGDTAVTLIVSNDQLHHLPVDTSILVVHIDDELGSVDGRKTVRGEVTAVGARYTSLNGVTFSLTVSKCEAGYD